MAFKLNWHDSRLYCMAFIYIYAHAHFDGLDLDARSQWLGGGKNSVELSAIGMLG